MTIGEYVRNVGKTASRFWNAVFFGDPRETLSGRIGMSIMAGGFWSRVPLPGWLYDHFIDATEDF